MRVVVREGFYYTRVNQIIVLVNNFPCMTISYKKHVIIMSPTVSIVNMTVNPNPAVTETKVLINNCPTVFIVTYTLWLGKFLK